MCVCGIVGMQCIGIYADTISCLVNATAVYESLAQSKKLNVAHFSYSLNPAKKAFISMIRVLLEISRINYIL